MSRKKRFVENLNTVEIEALEAAIKHGKSAIFRKRCHAVLLSNKGYTVEQIMDILNVVQSTVYNWFNKWAKQGIEGLKTKPGQGRKATLSIDNSDHVEAVKKAVKKTAQEGVNLLATIEQELEMEEQLSMRILSPFLKKLISHGNASELV